MSTGDSMEVTMKTKKTYIYIGTIAALSLIFTMCYYISYKHALYKFNQKATEREVKEEILKSNNEESVTVNFNETDKTVANTKYILQNIDLETNTLKEDKLPIPSEFIGLSREELMLKLDEYLEDMPLSEYHKGLISFELLSFSKNQILLKKTYDISKAAYLFYISVSDGFVVVFNNDLKTIYQYTGININDLSKEDKDALIEGIYVKTEAELYSILESYSS